MAKGNERAQSKIHYILILWFIEHVFGIVAFLLFWLICKTQELNAVEVYLSLLA